MQMKKSSKLAAAVLIGLLSVSAQLGYATPQNAAATQTPATHSWTMEQAVTSSVREAWVLGGRTEEGFFEIVQALTELSAQKRGITLPDTKEAGTKAGNWIKKQAKKDPDQLLYVIVDKAVQYTGTHQTAGASQ
ncbi:MAG TPA: hypothetical protein VGL97_17465 [Bryobacteraceae bacterium]